LRLSKLTLAYAPCFVLIAHDALFLAILAIWVITLVINTHTLYKWAPSPLGEWIDQTHERLLTILQPVVENLANSLSASGLYQRTGIGAAISIEHIGLISVAVQVVVAAVVLQVYLAA
jgi:hypothetical protein